MIFEINIDTRVCLRVIKSNFIIGRSWHRRMLCFDVGQCLRVLLVSRISAQSV